jgi:hypothetical protein
MFWDVTPCSPVEIRLRFRENTVSIFRVEDMLGKNVSYKGEWRRMGKWRYRSAILDLGTSWKWVVSFKPRGKCPQYLLDRRLGRSERCGVKKNLFTSRKPNLGHPAHSHSTLVPVSLPVYNLRADRIENTASNTSSVVTFLSVSAVTWFGCPGKMFTEPSPSNRRVLWLNFPGFQHTYHSIEEHEACP